MSVDVKPAGAISKEHTHTPITQLMDISADERRLTILTIKGMFHKGRAMEAMRPMVSIIFMQHLYGI